MTLLLRALRRALLIGVVGIVVLANPVGADPSDNQEMPPNPPRWNVYDVNGDGVMSDAECAALSDQDADEFANWINVPNQSGIFNQYHDREARRWLATHFEGGNYRTENCRQLTDGTPAGGGGVLGEVGGVVGGGVDAVGNVASAVNPVNLVKQGFDKVAEQFAEAYLELLGTATTFWLSVPSTSGQSEQSVSWLQDDGLMRSMTALAAVIGLIVAMVRTAFASRRGDDIWQTFFGLFRMLIVGSAGMWVLHLLLVAGDDWSRSLVQAANDGAPSDGTATVLTGLGSGLMFMLALLGIVTSLVQIVVLVARNALVVVLAGTWQVAAAVSVSGDSTLWRRMTAWLAALVLYKPAAAVVYAAGFRLLREDSSYGGEILAAVQGMMLLALAILVLPAMIRLVAPAAAMGGPSTAGLVAAGAGALATGAVVANAGGLAALVGSGSSGESSSSGSAGPSGPAALPPGSGPSGGPGPQGAAGAEGSGGGSQGPAGAGAGGAPGADGASEAPSPPGSSSAGGEGPGGGTASPAAAPGAAGGGAADGTSGGGAGGTSPVGAAAGGTSGGAAMGGTAGGAAGAGASGAAAGSGVGAAAGGPAGVAVAAVGAAARVAERTVGTLSEGGASGASGASSSLPPEPQGAGS